LPALTGLPDSGRSGPATSGSLRSALHSPQDEIENDGRHHARPTPRSVNSNVFSPPQATGSPGHRGHRASHRCARYCECRHDSRSHCGPASLPAAESRRGPVRSHAVPDRGRIPRERTEPSGSLGQLPGSDPPATAVSNLPNLPDGVLSVRRTNPKRPPPPEGASVAASAQSNERRRRGAPAAPEEPPRRAADGARCSPRLPGPNGTTAVRRSNFCTRASFLTLPRHRDRLSAFPQHRTRAA
jgi:hypothetical protein